MSSISISTWLPAARRGVFTRSAVALLTAAMTLGLPTSSSAQSVESDAQRLVSILDYLGADYGEAVVDGKIADQAEYVEQVDFVAEAKRLAAQLGARAPSDLASILDRLESAVNELADVADVAALTRDGRRLILDAFGLVQSPASAPSAERGARLFAQACAACHGKAGDPPASVLAEQDPPPRRLADRDVLATLSPYRVFNALTFGIEGTAMPSFDSLSVGERWDLAFHAFTMREDASPSPVPGLPGGTSLALLAASSDQELRERLAQSAPPSDVEAQLDALRMKGPYVSGIAPSPLVRARELVGDALAAARDGDANRAKTLLLDAYFEGFEPVEGTLRASEPKLVTSVEAAFARLRAAVDRGDVAAAESEASVVLRDLGRAELRLSSAPPSTSRWPGAVAGALIVLREGIEATLLVVILLAAVTAGGRAEARAWVHGGWIAALLAGVVTLLMVRAVTARLAARAELIEGGASLLAAAVLFVVAHWMFSNAGASGVLRQRVAAHLSGGRLFALAGLSFLAVFREAVETVLFLEGASASAGSARPVFVGAAVGAAALVVAALAIVRAGRRFPIQHFFLVSGALLLLLCFVFVGQGVHALVTVGVLKPRPLPLPSLPVLGVHADASALLAQAALLVLVVVSVAMQRAKRRGRAAAGPAAA